MLIEGRSRGKGCIFFSFPLPPPKKNMSVIKGLGGKRKTIEEKRKRKGKVERG